MGMLQDIGITIDDAGTIKLSLAAKEAFILGVRDKLQVSDIFLNFGITNTETGVINFLASDFLADNFYNPNKETFEQNKVRNSGWHGTWIPAYEKPVVNAFDLDSAQILKKLALWPGDPTEFIIALLMAVKAEIEEIVGDIRAFVMGFFNQIMNKLASLIVILTEMLAIGVSGDLVPPLKDLIDWLADLFGDPYGEEIKKKLNKKKEELIEKILKLLFEIPNISLPPIPTLEEILAYLGIEFEPPIDVNVQVPTLVFPGIFPIAPPGFAFQITLTIAAMIELIIDVMTPPISFLDPTIIIEKLKEGIIPMIEYVLTSIVSYLIEKIRQFIPQIDAMVVFLCSMMTYLQQMIKMLALVIIGHLIGPGIILMKVAEALDLM